MGWGNLGEKLVGATQWEKRGQEAGFKFQGVRDQKK